MPELKPFRGVRFAAPVVGELGNVISPPYDVVDGKLYERLLAASPYNVARLILPAGPQAHAAGAADDASYARSAELLQEWLSKGALLRDPSPAMYVYEQRFESGGRRCARTSLIALTRLMELGKGIRPHERTLSGPKADRLKLLRATNVNFGHVFAIYEDRGRMVAPILEETKKEPFLADATDDDGVGHFLWAITDASRLKVIEAAMREAELFIADGHHRYETALNYMRERPDSPAAQYRMMAFVDMASPGLVVQPTHRLVCGAPSSAPDAKAFLRRLEAQFSVVRFPTGARRWRPILDALRARQEAGENAIGVCLRGDTFIATLRRPSAMESLPARSEAWKRLDVAILHSLVLEGIMGIESAAVRDGKYVEYARDADVDRCIERVESGECQALFLLNPTKIEQVVAVARQGDEMPQKSTFFYPKVHTGLVMRVLDDSEVEMQRRDG